jgi:hypothetical protein
MDWPIHLNLNPNKNQISENGSHIVHIPVGKITRLGSKRHSVKLSKNLHLNFEQHAVDLAFALTAWKCQGGTFPSVALLKHSPNSPPLSY